jgi:hypothetical protein
MLKKITLGLFLSASPISLCYAQGTIVNDPAVLGETSATSAATTVSNTVLGGIKDLGKQLSDAIGVGTGPLGDAISTVKEGVTAAKGVYDTFMAPIADVIEGVRIIASIPSQAIGMILGDVGGAGGTGAGAAIGDIMGMYSKVTNLQSTLTGGVGNAISPLMGFSGGLSQDAFRQQAISALLSDPKRARTATGAPVPVSAAEQRQIDEYYVLRAKVVKQYDDEARAALLADPNRPKDISGKPVPINAKEDHMIKNVIPAQAALNKNPNDPVAATALAKSLFYIQDGPLKGMDEFNFKQFRQSVARSEALTAYSNDLTTLGSLEAQGKALTVMRQTRTQSPDMRSDIKLNTEATLFIGEQMIRLIAVVAQDSKARLAAQIEKDPEIRDRKAQ